MLKKIEIGLTVVSIMLGTYEILGRTGVVSGRTPIEAVQDAVAGDSGAAPTDNGTERSAPQAQDLVLRVPGCQVTADTVTLEVVAASAAPTRTLEGVQVSAASGALTETTTVTFEDTTTSSTSSVSLNTGPGSHTITLVVDADDRYAETDESNNVVVATAEVPADPAVTGSCAPV